MKTRNMLLDTLWNLKNDSEYFSPPSSAIKAFTDIEQRAKRKLMATLNKKQQELFDAYVEAVETLDSAYADVDMLFALKFAVSSAKAIFNPNEVIDAFWQDEMAKNVLDLECEKRGEKYDN